MIEPRSALHKRIRELYERELWSIQSIEDSLNCSFEDIDTLMDYDAARNDPWRRSIKDSMVEILEGKPGDEPLSDRHKRQWKDVYGIVRMAITSGNIEDARLAKTCAEALKLVQDGERQAHGMNNPAFGMGVLVVNSETKQVKKQEVIALD